VSTAEGAPPDYGTEFLEWLRTATERAWNDYPERTLADFQRAGVGGTTWRRGTRWAAGLSDAEIDSAERRYGLRFPSEYRLFLRQLHTTTPRLGGARFKDDVTLRWIEDPGFFDWRHDDAAIVAARGDVLEGLVFDVENNVLWPSSWGARPDRAEARRARLENLLGSAPQLIPIVGHRYLLPVAPHAVLSVVQSDIIVYGGDLRTFLLAELSSLLGITDDPAWSNVRVTDVPFWGELVQ